MRRRSPSVTPVRRCTITSRRVGVPCARKLSTEPDAMRWPSLYSALNSLPVIGALVSVEVACRARRAAAGFVLYSC